MAQLAIKGNITCGKKIIEILEMLGGINKYKITEANQNILYAIREVDNIIIGTYQTNTFIPFTLEEFIQKFPYKIGDKVIYKKGIFKVKSMQWDKEKNTVLYYIINEWLSVYVVETKDIKPYKDNNNMENLNKFNQELIKYIKRFCKEYYDINNITHDNIMTIEHIINYHVEIPDEIIKNIIDIILSIANFTIKDFIDEVNNANNTKIENINQLVMDIKYKCSNMIILKGIILQYMQWSNTTRGCVFYHRVYNELKKYMKINDIITKLKLMDIKNCV